MLSFNRLTPRAEMKGMRQGPDDDTMPYTHLSSACTHANYDLLRYANAEVAQQLHSIQDSRQLLQQPRMMIMMTNAHFLPTPSHAHRFFLSQAMLMVAMALDLV